MHTRDTKHIDIAITIDALARPNPFAAQQSRAEHRSTDWPLMQLAHWQRQVRTATGTRTFGRSGARTLRFDRTCAGARTARVRQTADSER